jgi:hypothetical protein
MYFMYLRYVMYLIYLTYLIKMDRLSTLMPKSLKKLGISNEVSASQVVNAANKWIQEEKIGEGVTATKFSNYILTVSTSSSSEAQECYMRSQELIDHIRNEYPQVKIKKVQNIRN